LVQGNADIDAAVRAVLMTAPGHVERASSMQTDFGLAQARDKLTESFIIQLLDIVCGDVKHDI
jgi:hypothetical protein